MPKTRTTLTIDEDILRSARIAAANRGMKEGEIIEEALITHLGLGVFGILKVRRTVVGGFYAHRGADYRQIPGVAHVT